MESMFTLSVSHKGRILFQTDPLSSTDGQFAAQLTSIMRQKFTQAEGFQVHVTEWMSRGKPTGI